MKVTFTSQKKKKKELYTDPQNQPIVSKNKWDLLFLFVFGG